MGAQIAAGSMVRIKVVHNPRSSAALKTLLRVMMKDASLRKQDERNNKNRRRMLQRRRRAGRLWPVVPSKVLPIAGAPGEEATVQATLDVLADLASLGSCVEVSPA